MDHLPQVKIELLCAWRLPIPLQWDPVHHHLLQRSKWQQVILSGAGPWCKSWHRLRAPNFSPIFLISLLAVPIFRLIFLILPVFRIFYGVFTTPRNAILGSAVCRFSVDDLESSFEGKFKNQESLTSNWLPMSPSQVGSSPFFLVTCSLFLNRGILV